jgi:hypothetical protein
MWGVNIYSTLAGMIANSISFPLMLLFIASAVRDVDDGAFRVRTSLLLAGLMASHFFTSVVAVITVALLPFLQSRARLGHSLRILLCEGAIGTLLMAWWLVPLIAKRDYAIDFGTNWEVRLPGSLPPFALWLLPFAAAAVGLGIVRRIRFVALGVWMLCVSVFLFAVGYRISPVFVNVRLWPFVLAALLILEAAGIGLLLSGRPWAGWAAAGVLLASAALAVDRPGEVRAWARWNYQGLQRKARRAVFDELVLPLRGSPGRLANDLHPDNNSLGSSRIFECVPHLTGKPILEGGLVNSAVGSLFAYTIQSETSQSCAGYPPLVTPHHFDFERATRHLELFNVKHFIARWHGTRSALRESPRWRFVHGCLAWDLYELTSHDGRTVVIPARPPLAVRTSDWKATALAWMACIEMVDQPVILLKPGEPADRLRVPVMSEAAFASLLRETAGGGAGEDTAPAAWSAILEEDVSDTRIRFRTTAPGRPHLIKCGHYPNWKVRGADAVYRVTPCFMLVYPDREEVELYYGRTVSDNTGLGFSLAGLILLAGLGAIRWRHARTRGAWRSTAPAY